MEFYESVEMAPLYDDGFDDIEASVNEATCKSAADALVACVNRYGRVDMEYMSAVSGLSVERLADDLRGEIFQDPMVFEDKFRLNINDGWLLRSQYLCGNIWGKLAVARKMNKKFRGHFDDNIKALKSALPDALGLEDIHISLGAPWVPVEVYIDFIMDLLRFGEAPEVYLNKELSVWKIDAPKSEVNSVLNTSTYGTYRILSLSDKQIFLHIMLPDIYSQDLPKKVEKIKNQYRKGLIRNARNRPIMFDYMISADGNLHIYDYPTTLSTTYDTAKIILDIDADDSKDICAEERFVSKERNLFAATLQELVHSEKYALRTMKPYYSADELNLKMEQVKNMVENYTTIEEYETSSVVWSDMN